MPELTLMAVHAHPDDECLGTGGVLARYAAEGIRTVLVTCTDGSCGDGPDGVKPGQPGHDPDSVAAVRRAELERSCAVLGIAHLEMLGYRDSGMMGWPQNDAPGAFWTTPVPVAASGLGRLITRYRPQVVVTYNEIGFYGHPDHIQAHRVAVAASAASSSVEKLYYTAVSKSDMAEWGRRMEEAAARASDASGAGGQPDSDAEGRPGPPEDMDPMQWATPDDQVTTRVDVAAWAGHKYRSLLCHASQPDNKFFVDLGEAVFGELMSSEAFVLAQDRRRAQRPEDDLFAGLR